MKKALLITIIILVLGGGFFYFKNKNNSKNPDGSSTNSFKNFFNFGSKETPAIEGPGNELDGEFTAENPDEVQPNENESSSGTRSSTSTSVFGTNGPFTPLSTNGSIDSGNDVSGGGLSSGGNIASGGSVGSGNGVPDGTEVGSNGSGSSSGATQCTTDDTVIDFTPEEIDRLRALEQRFYALAPNLRTDQDIQAESANYSSYKLLNQKYSELISYCENKSPLLPENINRRVATPLYSDASANAYFTDGPDADGVIDIQSSVPKLKEIEKFFRINIW